MPSTYDRPHVFAVSRPIPVADEVIGAIPIAAPEKMKQLATSTGNAEPIDETRIQELIQQGYTRSLISSMEEAKSAFPLRIWIVDNSSSMHKPDGHSIVDNLSTRVKMVPCTRWEEIRACVEYHIRLASLLRAPTRFRLLNHPGNVMTAQEISIAEIGGESNPFEADDAVRLWRRMEPRGCTPLTRHVRDIRTEVLSMEPALRRAGQRVAIIIATDGLPTDDHGNAGERERRTFIESLRQLEGLPIWVVIRLCTDEESVVSFYNDLDAILELSVDVLDDFKAEAQEIYEVNPWLNYGLPLHRMREMGHPDRLFDLIDERPFTKSEIRSFCGLLFGEDKFDGVSDPSIDWDAFISHLSRLAERESQPWHPIREKKKSWVSSKKLNRIHGKKRFAAWF